MFLAVLYREEEVTPAVEPVTAVPEVISDEGEVIQPAVEEVKAQPAVTQTIVAKVFLELDANRMAANLHNKVEGLKYYSVEVTADGPQIGGEVELQSTRKPAPTQTVHELRVGGKTIEEVVL